MTFKHTDFYSSEVMRSLERVAQEKGLIKPSILDKIASLPTKKKLELTPSSNIMDNIFKLSAGLKMQGLKAEAMELENNFLAYKQAQTLYDAHNETGEDVIQFAHPEGSHKMEGLESDEATFEDILDRHVKFIKMIEKNPTGKLSSVFHILSEVKKALAAPPNKDDILNQIKTNLGQIKILCMRALDVSDSETTMTLHFWRNEVEQDTLLPDAAKLVNLEKLKILISQLTYRLKPGYFSGITPDTWAIVSVDLSQASNLTDECIKLRTAYNVLVGQEEAKNVGNSTSANSAESKQVPEPDIGQKIRTIAGEYTSLANLINSDDPKDATALAQVKAFLQKKAGELQGTANSFDKEVDKAAVTSMYQSIINKAIADLAKIQKGWM